MRDPSNGYDAVAEAFITSRSRIGAAHVRDWARSLAPGATVLDLGCGHGMPVTETLLAAGCRVYAVDASPAMVAAFRARFPNVPVACEPAEVSSCFGRTYEGVVAWGLLFLLAPDTQPHVIANAARVLVSGGSLLVSAPAEAGTWTDALTGHLSTSLGAVEYRRLLAREGLTVRDEWDDDGDNHYYVASKT